MGHVYGGPYGVTARPPAQPSPFKTSARGLDEPLTFYGGGGLGAALGALDSAGGMDLGAYATDAVGSGLGFGDWNDPQLQDGAQPPPATPGPGSAAGPAGLVSPSSQAPPSQDGGGREHLDPLMREVLSMSELSLDAVGGHSDLYN